MAKKFITVKASTVDADTLFNVDGLEYRRGDYTITYGTILLDSSDNVIKSEVTVGIRSVNENQTVITRERPISEYSSDGVTTFSDLDSLILYLNPIVFAADGGGIPIKQQADNYSALIAGSEIGDIAYVENSQGTAWLPGTLGGNYYPEGWYVWDGSVWVSDRNAIANEINNLLLSAGGLDNRILVTQANKDTTLGGTIDSTKQYFLDGIIDMGSTQITVPPTGMTILGLSFDISGLTSSEDNYTMFVSESIAIGSGNLLGADYYVSVTGAGSKVYELYDSTGFNAFEFARINYINCTSLGDIYDYRQGLESGTGRFGGSPSLTLHGLWRGGYRITTSIVRSLAGTMTAPLFKEGVAFQMNSRFLTDINCDLPTLAPLCDFEVANFPNPSTIQVKGAILSRDGAFDANDSNIFPNLTPADLPCDWDNNIGIANTFVGGAINNDAEVQTVISAQNVQVDLNGTFSTIDLQHFDSPSAGRLRHIGINPREFTVNWDLLIDGKNNDNYELFLMKTDANAVTTTVYSQVRTVNNFQGGRDVGIWSGQTSVILNQNDFVFWQIANLLDDDNCTLEIDSTWSVKER